MIGRATIVSVSALGLLTKLAVTQDTRFRSQLVELDGEL